MRSPVCLTARRRRPVARHYPLPSFLPSFLSFLLFSSSFPLSLLFTRSPSTGYSLFLCFFLFLSSPACLRQWKRSVRGSRSRARICGPARWMASQRERSRCVSLFVFLAVDIRYDRLPSSSSCSCSIGPKTIHDGIGSSPLPPASCSGGHRSQRFRVSLVPRRSDGSVGTKRKLYRSVIAPRILVRIKVRKIDSRVYYPNEWEGGEEV